VAAAIELVFVVEVVVGAPVIRLHHVAQHSAAEVLGGGGRIVMKNALPLEGFLTFRVVPTLLLKSTRTCGLSGCTCTSGFSRS
jgi:hypothetical protein